MGRAREGIGYSLSRLIFSKKRTFSEVLFFDAQGVDTLRVEQIVRLIAFCCSEEQSSGSGGRLSSRGTKRRRLSYSTWKSFFESLLLRSAQDDRCRTDSSRRYNRRLCLCMMLRARGQNRPRTPASRYRPPGKCACSSGCAPPASPAYRPPSHGSSGRNP